MTQLVAGLEEARLVQRRADPDDGRRCLVALTPTGRALVRRARARKIAWVQSAIDDLAPDQRSALRAAAAALDEQALGARSPQR